ncbi:MAG: ABC transporter substrate-binding protein [Actinobacteria bacterium]|nr:ABC transporter substrate-binding protein [Actinomycetota bacterium]
MKASKRELTVLLLVIASTLSACAPTTTTPPPTPITVQLAWTHQSNFSGFYAAEQRGFYAAEGLAVTFVEGGPQVDLLSPVLDGTAQFGVTGADELIKARAQGRPVRALATIYRRSPVVYISLAELGITRPQEFAGKTIRVAPNLIASLHAMTARVGVPPDQYDEVTLPSDLAAFATGEVPVWGGFIDGLAVAAQQAGYEINIVYPDDYGVHFYGHTVFATDDFIEQNPDLVLRFVRATLQGWDYIIQDPEQNGDLVALYNPTADVALENLRMSIMLPLVNTGQDHIGWMRPETWTGMEKTLREQGVITQPLDVTQVYTLQFLEEIYGEE